MRWDMYICPTGRVRPLGTPRQRGVHGNAIVPGRADTWASEDAQA
jgi:hypothetical protein